MFYRLVRKLFHLYFKCMYRWKYHGKKNLPAQGPFIICSNHTSWFDPPLIGCLLPGKHKVNFMAKEELFKISFIGSLLRKLGAFPVKRNVPDKNAVKHALQVLEEGGILGLFPEGTRSRGDGLGKLHRGAAAIALRSKAPVLPVFIKWPGKFFRAAEVKIGPLISFTEEGKIKGKVLETATSLISEEMQKLL
ncbi:MAG: 1-acyl-sn-glycerol-3-phosphate acyltransferase [Firmicutes bacterium]|nr:1-acyl-sn-glycerol-3-phosphate acyltransferase [Bacillota bacterium]